MLELRTLIALGAASAKRVLRESTFRLGGAVLTIVTGVSRDRQSADADPVLSM